MLLLLLLLRRLLLFQLHPSLVCHQPSLMVWAAVQGVLLPHEIQLLMNHEHHKPNFVLAVLTQVVDNLPTSDARKQAMDASLTSFHQAVGSCERMVKTPIPRSYTRLVLPQPPCCPFSCPSVASVLLLLASLQAANPLHSAFPGACSVIMELIGPAL